MTRGFSKSEAVALIVRGFMDIGIFGLPKELETSIQRMIDTTTMRVLYLLSGNINGSLLQALAAKTLRKVKYGGR